MRTYTLEQIIAAIAKAENQVAILGRRLKFIRRQLTPKKPSAQGGPERFAVKSEAHQETMRACLRAEYGPFRMRDFNRAVEAVDATITRREQRYFLSRAVAGGDAERDGKRYVFVPSKTVSEPCPNRAPESPVGGAESSVGPST